MTLFLDYFLGEPSMMTPNYTSAEQFMISIARCRLPAPQYYQ